MNVSLQIMPLLLLACIALNIVLNVLAQKWLLQIKHKQTNVIPLRSHLAGSIALVTFMDTRVLLVINVLWLLFVLVEGIINKHPMLWLLMPRVVLPIIGGIIWVIARHLTRE